MKGASDQTDLSSGLLETRLKLGYRLTGRAGVEGFLAAGEPLEEAMRIPRE